MPASRKPPRWLMAPLLLGLFLEGALAQGDQIPAELSVQTSTRGGQLSVSFDVSDAFTEKFRQRLKGGLTRRAIIMIQLQDRAEETIASVERLCQIRLEIWDDVLYVQTITAGKEQITRHILFDDALRACGKLKNLELARLETVSTRTPLSVGVRVVLNPVSSELLERAREFTSNPNGSGPGQSQAFLGAVGRLFGGASNNEGESFIFRSRSFLLPSTPPGPSRTTP
jgi:hypothetical protein